MQIHPEFLRDPGARDILAALARAGEETRFIGGCVRDTAAGMTTGDIDLATTALPETVLNVLGMAGFTARPLGHAHGVTFAWRDGRKYEIATLREDVQTDGRHAMVAFTRHWALDAARRDFTINALSADADGNVFDYTDGLADLAMHRVRFIGEANARIQEDYLRILRFYRFHARFGGSEPDSDARTACRAHRAGLARISSERITEELRKLLSSENPLSACAAMTADKILSDIIPELDNLPALETLLAREKIYGPLPWLARLAAWGGMVQHFNEAFLDHFRFARAERAEMTRLATLDFHHALNHALHYEGTPTVRAAVILRASDSELPTFMEKISAWQPREFPLHAEDVLAMGVVPGPGLGKILRNTENWWLANNCAANAEECKNYAATLATDSSA